MNETFRTEMGNRLTVEPMWAGYRIVLHGDTFCRIGRTSYIEKEHAYIVMRANSVRVDKAS